MELNYILFFFLAFIITEFIRRYFIKKKILDFPSDLKTHSKPTPKGLGISISMVLIFFIYYNFMNSNFDIFINNLEIPRLWVLISSLIIIYLVSVLDDFIGINLFLRLLIQVTCVFLTISSLPAEFNLQPNDYFIEKIILPPKLNILLIFYFWLYCINVTNFIDGVDGYVSIKLILNYIFFLYLSIYENLFFLEKLFIMLFLLSLIILYYNKKPAKFFLGDSGSIVFGFLNGWIYCILIFKGYFLEIILLNLFFYVDILFTITKRIIEKKSIFERHNYFIFKQIFFKEKFYLKKLFFINFLNFIIVILFISMNIEYYYKIVTIIFMIIFYFILFFKIIGSRNTRISS
jgi:UDP-N-acetylmuramyl pentapeptide phosphotransferase/UDP-N-acetylglucosamine-1-phosphate transferase